MSLPILAFCNDKLLPSRVLPGANDYEAVVARPANDTLAELRRPQRRALGKGDPSNHALVSRLKRRRGKGIHVGKDARHQREPAEDAPFPRVGLVSAAELLAAVRRGASGMGHVKDVQRRLVRGAGQKVPRRRKGEGVDGGGVDAAAQLGQLGAVARRVDADEGARLAGAGEQLAVRAELDGLERRRVRGDDADVAGGELDELDLAGGAAGEGELLVRHAAQAGQVVGRLVYVQQLGRLGKGVDADAALQHDDYSFTAELDAADGAEGGNL